MIFRRPYEEVLQWPAAHVKLWRAYLSHEPSPEERIEYAVARFAQHFVAMNTKEGAPKPRLTDFIFPAVKWDRVAKQHSAAGNHDRYTDSDRQSMAALMSIGRNRSR